MREFSLDLKTEEFKIGDKLYFMKEMDGKRRDDYNQSISNRMRLDNNGKPAGFKTVTGMDADLLTRCVVDPETDKFVDAKTVNSWPSTVVEELGNWALEFNGLNKKAEKDAKNDLEGSDSPGGE